MVAGQVDTGRGYYRSQLCAVALALANCPRFKLTHYPDAVICHHCDFAGCANPGHMRLGTNATNRVEYFARRRNLANPLADVRGAAGRTRAVAAAIRTGLADHEDAACIEVRIRAAEAAGLPLTLW